MIAVFAVGAFVSWILTGLALHYSSTLYLRIENQSNCILSAFYVDLPTQTVIVSDAYLPRDGTSVVSPDDLGVFFDTSAEVGFRAQFEGCAPVETSQFIDGGGLMYVIVRDDRIDLARRI